MKIFKTFLFLFIITLVTPAFSQPVGQLPDDEEKTLVEIACFKCHSSFNITTSAGYDDPQQWKDLFSTMVSLPSSQADTIANYLARHFPANLDRQPIMVLGDTEIKITE